MPSLPPAAAERAAAALARRRHARLLHPTGRTFSAEALIWGTSGPQTGVPLLDLPGRYPATVRLSKGVPTPSGWPDVLGLGAGLPGRPARRPGGRRAGLRSDRQRAAGAAGGG